MSLPSSPNLALGKVFFLENTLPSAPNTALSKEFFFEMSLPSAPVKALGKEEFFLKKNENPLCGVPYSWHLAKTPFAKCHVPALGKDFFFASKFFVQPF